MGGNWLRSTSAISAAAIVVAIVAVGAPGRAAEVRRGLPPAGYGAGPGYCTGYAGGVTSGFSFDNVYACDGSTTGSTTFDAPGAGVYAWQCVELSARFLWAIDGIWAGPGSGVQDGADLVSVVHGGHPQIAVGTSGPGSVPVPGDVISLGPGGGSDPTFGHTAVVISANGGTGQFEIMSENDPENSAGEQSLQVDLTGGHNGDVLFNGAWTRASWLEVGQFVPPPDGTFVQLQGTIAVYEMAGGAPLYVSNWSAVGGPHSVDVLTQAEWNTLSPVPANGTFLNADGPVYEVAGGAPLFVSNWANVGGVQPYVTIDPWDIANIANPAAHLRAVPANGTVLHDNQTEMVYVVAGGAPLYVSTWSAIGGPQPAVGIDDWDIANITNPAAHLNRVPANGTFLNADGPVYEVAGGAPLYVSNWANVGGVQPYVTIDPWDVANITNPAAHLRALPANGTVLHDNQNQMVFEVAGGAPLYVSTCARVSGCRTAVNIDGWDISNAGSSAAHLRKLPGNGTFLRAGAHGAIYRVAGGYPFKLSSCRAIGGCKHPVTVDPWDFTHLTKPRTHLLPVPRNGTIVRCFPSRRYWSFKSGKRHRSKPSSKAVAVDDSSVRPFPISSRRSPA